MKTVNEVSKLTGVSVRALHYYDEIGLLKPAFVNEAGYRFYDEEALKKLQQILLFKEFDMPLKEIKRIMENPSLDRKKILMGQRYALAQKKLHLERLLSNVDGILKGEKEMDFTVFEKEDIEELFWIFVKNAPENVLETSIRDFGSMEAFHKNYVEKAMKLYNKPETRQILLEAYGDKEAVIDSARNPMAQEELSDYQKKTDSVTKRLVLCKREGLPVQALEVKALICEYALATKRAFRLKNERQVMTGIAETYENYPQARVAFDRQYEEEGIGTYLAEAVRNFYGM